MKKTIITCIFLSLASASFAAKFACPSAIICHGTDLASCQISNDGSISLFNHKQTHSSVTPQPYRFSEAHITNLNSLTPSDYACSYSAEHDASKVIWLHPNTLPAPLQPTNGVAGSHWDTTSTDAECMSTNPASCIFKD